MGKITIILTMVIGLAVSGSARATVFDYDYVGNNFTRVVAPYMTDMGVNIWMSVELPSNINFVGDISGLISEIMITDGIQEYSSALGNFAITRALFLTDGTGEVVDWELEFVLDPPIGGGEDRIFSRTCIWKSDRSQGCDIPGIEQDRVRITAAEFTFADVEDNPGLWSQGQKVAPVPEPSTLLLFSSGLAGLGWYRRRRKRSV